MTAKRLVRRSSPNLGKLRVIQRAETRSKSLPPFNTGRSWSKYAKSYTMQSGSCRKSPKSTKVYYDMTQPITLVTKELNPFVALLTQSSSESQRVGSRPRCYWCRPAGSTTRATSAPTPSLGPARRRPIPTRLPRVCVHRGLEAHCPHRPHGSSMRTPLGHDYNFA